MTKQKPDTDQCICTVLLISYNHEPYIRLAIESVLAQKTKYKFKIHIFDDASTDGTSEIIKEYTERYPDLITAFIAEENRGAQGNFWAAYKSVDTKYSAMLECDDYWCDEEKLELQIDALEQNPDCSFCAHNTIYHNKDDVYRTKEDGDIFVYNRNIRNTGKYGAEDFKPLYGAGWANHNNSRVIRMSCVDLDSLTDKEDFLYDNAQFFYLLSRGNIYFIQRVMSVYVMNMASTFTSLQVEKKLRGHYDRMIHINKTLNYEFERLIYRHLSSFTFYWLAYDEIEAGIVKDRGVFMTILVKTLKKYRYDVLLYRRLRKEARKNIQKLTKRLEGQ